MPGTWPALKYGRQRPERQKYFWAASRRIWRSLLAHRAGIAACAVTTGGAMLGCDLESVEPRSDAFVADYFTAEEQEVVRQACTADRFTLIALIWSAKESALKALRAGLRIDTRSLSVALDDLNTASLKDLQPRTPDALAATSHFLPPWQCLRVRYMPQHIFHGWWFRCADLLHTEISSPPTPPPITSGNICHSLCSCAQKRHP